MLIRKGEWKFVISCYIGVFVAWVITGATGSTIFETRIWGLSPPYPRSLESIIVWNIIDSLNSWYYYIIGLIFFVGATIILYLVISFDRIEKEEMIATQKYNDTQKYYNQGYDDYKYYRYHYPKSTDEYAIERYSEGWMDAKRELDLKVPRVR